jgi:hypothetical protein
MYAYIYIYIWVCIYIYIQGPPPDVYLHTRTHIHIYIYIDMHNVKKEARTRSLTRKCMYPEASRIGLIVTVPNAPDPLVGIPDYAGWYDNLPRNYEL